MHKNATEIGTNFIFTHFRQTCFAYNLFCAFLHLFQRIQNLTYMLVVPFVAGVAHLYSRVSVLVSCACLSSYLIVCYLELSLILLVVCCVHRSWRTCTPTCLYMLAVPVKAPTLLDATWSYL
jgi:hypothetical protein